VLLSERLNSAIAADQYMDAKRIRFGCGEISHVRGDGQIRSAVVRATAASRVFSMFLIPPS
jgi:hypothetical protein